MVDVGGGTAFPMVNFVEGAAAFRSGTTDTNGTVVAAANPSRRMGVFVANLDTTATLGVGDTTATALLTLAPNGTTGTSGMKASVWVYGQGQVVIKTFAGAGVAWTSYEI